MTPLSKLAACCFVLLALPLLAQNPETVNPATVLADLVLQRHRVVGQATRNDAVRIRYVPTRPRDSNTGVQASDSSGESMARPRAKTLAQQKAFLKQYAECGVVTWAAEALGIARQRHYDWLADTRKYPDYTAQFEDAHEQACDRLDREAIRRAVEGVEVRVYGRGPGPNASTQVVGSVTKYSDRLLEFMLRARRPHKFRDRVSTEVSGTGGAPVKFTLKLD